MSPEVNESIVSVVENFIRSELLYGYSGEAQFDENTNLIESGVIDSITLLRLVTFIEERFQIKMEDEELVPEHFQSLKSMETFVSKHLKSGS
jgi:acyl carrier protein